MKIYVIIQARMSSKRLPGKVIQIVNEKPLLIYLIERIRRANVDGLILATSVEKSDDPVFQLCQEAGIICERGPLDNVSLRIKEVLLKHGMDAFVRISGDSPLIDQSIVSNAVSIFKNGEYDLVTNVLERSFPKGESIEILNSDVFLSAFPKVAEPEYCEHVMPYFYQNLGKNRIYNIHSGIDAGKIQLSVDTKEDIEMFEKIVLKMDRPHWEYTWKDIIKLKEDINK